MGKRKNAETDMMKLSVPFTKEDRESIAVLSAVSGVKPTEYVQKIVAFHLKKNKNLVDKLNELREQLV